MRRATNPSPRRSAQRGVSLVELMIGAAVSLMIVAAGSVLTVSNLREQRTLLHEAQLMQNLRTAADVVARDLRRAGYWDRAVGVAGTSVGEVVVNPYASIDFTDAAPDQVQFGYARQAIDSVPPATAVAIAVTDPRLGFRLRNGAIDIDLGRGNWQALTDRGRLIVTTFRLTPRVTEIDLGSHCARSCETGDSNGDRSCPPRQQLRSLAIEMTGRLPESAVVSRTLRTEIRVRNDAVVGTCPA